MNRIYLISFIVICLINSGLTQNEKNMKRNSTSESDSCLTIEKLEILKKHILNNCWSPSSVGPPLPVRYYYRDTINHNQFEYSMYYDKDQKLEREEIHISNTVNDFSYYIKIEQNRIKLEYESPENPDLYMELIDKYQNHFCKLIKKI